MSASLPSLSQPLRNLLQGLAEQAPTPMLPLLSLFAQHAVTEGELLHFIASAPPNDNGLIAIRLALAKWDSSDALSLVDERGVETLAGTAGRRAAIVRELGLTAEAGDQLRQRIPVHANGSVVISRVFEPWYGGARHVRSTRYWDDYERYLAETKQWEASSIAGLDVSTNTVVERLSDPVRIGAKRTKGLVVGYVQSGKTANFTGVAAKAIDAGYRLIIVMTGTIELLRSQTQRRIDMELTGVENVLAGQDPDDPNVARGLDYQQDEDWLADRFVRHTQAALDQPGVARIRRVTTHHSDYKSLPQGMSQLRYDRVDKTKPLNDPANLFHTDAYVVVIKKNSGPLNKLIGDLKPLQELLNELPALIIDDESDLASVNTTNPTRTATRTKINRLIGNLLDLMPRAQYVGYTATPFANVFADPDDDSNIFPSDFVLSLPRPHGYTGVQEFHDIDPDWESTPRDLGTSNELAFVRAIAGDPTVDPQLHEAELTAALDAWVLSGALKMYRTSVTGMDFRHHTMLVHEGVQTDQMDDSAVLLRRLWDQGSFTTAAGLGRLRTLYDEDYLPVMQSRGAGAPVPSSFDEVKPFIAAAFAEMTSGGSDPVLIVNSDKDVQRNQEALDFDAKRVWRVLVGGTKLSRGFTVEGLTVSYFRRSARMADTLMQAGRWFGFRTGYADLVRLYIRRDLRADLYAAFEALLLDEEAFRAELAKYEGFDEDGLPLVEPRQIPPLVSQHLPWLRPTARNKMFNAIIVTRANVGTFHQLSSIPPRDDKQDHKKNRLEFFEPLLKRATAQVQLPYVDPADDAVKQQVARVGLVDASTFRELFAKLEWHTDFAKVIGPLTRFIETATAEGGIQDWAVVWPQRQTAGRSLWSDELRLDVPIFRRARREAPRFDFTGENKRNLLSAGAISAGADVSTLGQSTTRGTLVVSMVADQEHDTENTTVAWADVVGLLSLRVPDRAARSRRQLIQWTVEVAGQPNAATVNASAPSTAN